MSNRYSVLWVRYQNHVCSVFGLGISILLDGPIRRVMYSPCFSASDLRFLVLPVPAMDMGLPYSWLTASGSSPYRGSCVPHTQAPTRVAPLSTPSSSCVPPFIPPSFMPSF